MQAEGGKGQVPLPEGIAAPVAVAGVANALPGIIHREVVLAGAVALLGQGDGQGIPVPVAGEVLGLPVLGILRRGRVGIAGIRVGVLRLFAGQDPLIAGVRVDVGGLRRLLAPGGIALRRRPVHRVRGGLGGRLRAAFRLAADQAGLVAVLGMSMLLQAALGLRRQGDGREDQGIGGAEDHRAGKDGDRPAPAAALLMGSGHIPCRLRIFHLRTLLSEVSQISFSAPGRRH